MWIARGDRAQARVDVSCLGLEHCLLKRDRLSHAARVFGASASQKVPALEAQEHHPNHDSHFPRWLGPLIFVLLTIAVILMLSATWQCELSERHLANWQECLLGNANKDLSKPAL